MPALKNSLSGLLYLERALMFVVVSVALVGAVNFVMRGEYYYSAIVSLCAVAGVLSLVLSFRLTNAPKLAKAEEIRKIYKQLDSTKRKSLQPGSRVIPVGWTDSDIHTILKDKPKSKTTARVEANQLGRKPKAHQPGVNPYDRERAAESARTVSHKFFGSQLTVGGAVVIQGLSKRSHTLEITKTNQLFVDNTEVKINHDTILRIKRELFKIQNP